MSYNDNQKREILLSNGYFAVEGIYVKGVYYDEKSRQVFFLRKELEDTIKDNGYECYFWDGIHEWYMDLEQAWEDYKVNK